MDCLSRDLAGSQLVSVRPGSEAHLCCVVAQPALNPHVSTFWDLYERARPQLEGGVPEEAVLLPALWACTRIRLTESVLIPLLGRKLRRMLRAIVSPFATDLRHSPERARQFRQVYLP
jgi:hypothetical protein